MTPRNNLGVQTQIVAGAKAFVGTCGSIAWLAPRLGVDTSALFVDPKWLHAHLPVAMRAYHKLGAGRFAAADLRALDPLGAWRRSRHRRRPRMKVLFIARHFTYFRNFESVIAALAERGHRVHLAADREEALGGRELVDRLAARYPRAGHASASRRSCSGAAIGGWRARCASGSTTCATRTRATRRRRRSASAPTSARPCFVLALARLPFRGAA